MKVPGAILESDLIAIEKIANIFKPKSVLEIGSLSGRSTVCWAMSLMDSEIWAVDPWRNYSAKEVAIVQIYGEKEQYNFTSEELNKSMYSSFLKHTRNYPNIKHIRCYSEELPHIWVGEKFDLCFIDGDHSAKGVVNDLEVVDLLLKEGGIVCGHDFGIDCVKLFVTEWCDRKGYILAVMKESNVYIAVPGEHNVSQTI